MHIIYIVDIIGPVSRDWNAQQIALADRGKKESDRARETQKSSM